jgi:hypothetical protein
VETRNLWCLVEETLQLSNPQTPWSWSDTPWGSARQVVVGGHNLSRVETRNLLVARGRLITCGGARQVVVGGPVRAVQGLTRSVVRCYPLPLSSDNGTNKTVEVRIWPLGHPVSS